MILKKEPGLLVLLAFCLLSTYSCSLDDPGTGSNTPALSLEIEQQLSLTHLSWPAVKVTDFKEYILLRSSGDIPDAPTPETNANVIVLKRLDDVDVTSFSTADLVVGQQTCYKLYVAASDRFLYSPTVCIHPSSQFLPGFYDRIAHENGNQQIFMFDRNISRVATYNLENNNFDKIINDGFFSNPFLHTSSANGQQQGYISDRNQGFIRKYNLPGLDGIQTKQFSVSIESLTSSDQFLFVTLFTSEQSFQILNRHNLNTIDTEPGLGNQSSRTIGVFHGNPTIVLEVSPSEVIRYAIGTDGRVIEKTSHTSGILQTNTQNGTANSENYFITGFNGAIFNRDAELLGTLKTGNNSFITISRISPDEKTAVAFVSNNINFTLEYYDISDPGKVKLKKSLELPSTTFGDMFIENNKVYLFGTSFETGQAQTVVLQFPMF